MDEGLLRELAPQVLGALVRRYGSFATAEDAVQEALLAASRQWDAEPPEDPRAWLISVASRRMTDLLRSERARRDRETRWALLEVPAPEGEAADDTLILLFLCCHPSLSPASQIALTLRAVGGLSTQEIARAFMVPEATMTRRITRAKQSIKDSGGAFRMPPAPRERLAAVLHVLYLIFSEGYAAQRADLATEAIRLTRLMRTLMPQDGEVAGLLALMLLTDARRTARVSASGELVPMESQDRTQWNAAYIEEGVALITAALPRGTTGPYQVQAAIAALHDEAPSAAETDWPQIRALYELLLRISDNPMVSLNHAVAVAMTSGPREGLALVDKLAGDPRVAEDHRLFAVRAHLLEMSGDASGARSAYLAAADRARSLQQQRYLNGRAARLAP
jgi:RNA polymerase sigma factor (sigma-70 family)